MTLPKEASASHFPKIGGCHYIKKLPEQVGCMEKLHDLVINATCIKELPKLRGLKQLEILSAKNCVCLANILSSVSQLTSLTDLILDQSKSALGSSNRWSS